MAKYIFVMGGVLSSLGKGIATATIGMLLKEIGHKVTLQKFDPYLNVDPGTMSPFQHGEVFVTDDGAETDLDLGHYERFVDESLTRESSCSAGLIYETVLKNEREGVYKGNTVQVIPHVTNEIIRRMTLRDEEFDVIITEIGGTVGDIESHPFMEAVRQIRLEKGAANCLCVLLTYVPYLKAAGELKTKPTQHSVYKLREIGIQPDILFCRSEKKFAEDVFRKIALFTNVPRKNVINAVDVDFVYKVPLVYQESGLAEIICEHFNLPYKEPRLEGLKSFIEATEKADKDLCIAICGKYVRHQDAYKSVEEALQHAASHLGCKLKLKWIDSERQISDSELDKSLKGVHGILVPGGFGIKEIAGKLAISKYARIHNIPYLGICLGLHGAVIDIARNVCGLSNANSAEFDPDSPEPVVHLKTDAKYKALVNNKIRLGAHDCVLTEDSLAHQAYGCDLIQERHRHRYEINNAYEDILAENGMVVTGRSPDGSLIEIMEYTPNDFFVGVQFQPEFKSRPQRPHPLIREFEAAALKFGEGTIKAR